MFSASVSRSYLVTIGDVWGLMAKHRDPALFRWNLLAYVCVATALILLLAMTGWGALRDFAEVRHTLLQARLSNLRTHAARTVVRIQDQLSSAPEAVLDSDEIERLLRRQWELSLASDASRLYSALVTDDGMVVVHSNPALEGTRLPPTWHEGPVADIDEDAVATRFPGLTGGPIAYDVSLPIYLHGREVGEYHSGFNVAWFEDVVAEKNRELWTRWLAILGLSLLVVLAASVSMYQIVKRTVLLNQMFELAEVRRLTELGQLVAGIAHEIRNPLNAIRLNLHVLLRTQDAGQSDANAEAQTMFDEMNREIDRMEGLMRILLGYARPERAHNEDVDVVHEVDAMVHFIRPVVERHDITLELRLPVEPAMVHIDRKRLRQVLLNLLNNSREAVGDSGRIEVEVARRRGGVELLVEDDGPGVPESSREQIFEPFFTTKELGTGLGLSLVKRFVEELGGSIHCERSDLGGARFRIEFREAVPAPAVAATT